MTKEEFLKNLPYAYILFGENEIYIESKFKFNLVYNFKKFKVGLRIRSIDFNTEIFNTEIIDLFINEIKNRYYLIKHKIDEYNILEFRFVIRKHQDLYQVIEILESYFLIFKINQ